MNPRILLLIFFCLTARQMFGQARLRKLPANINHPSINNSAPYISLDGNSMVYLADVAEDYQFTLNYSAREGVSWKDPVTLPNTINHHLNFLKGFGLSPDGKTLYVANMKHEGMGGYDLYMSQFSGITWSVPVNMLLPVNSKSNEACPSVSADGSMMFFMRCDIMDATKADNCKILMMKRKANGQWDMPVELPPSINTGNSQTPRIMGDGETLLFSSNRLQPNKGGMDLYYTRLSNGQWDNPRPLDFANTAADDQYVSATSLGRYLLKEAPGQRKSEIVEMLFPAEIRPKGVMKIEGLVSGPENPSGAFVSAFDMKAQKRVFSTKPAKDGTFVAYLKEGGSYDLSIDPEADNYTFYSRIFDLTGEKFSLLEKLKATIKPAAVGDEIPLDGVIFKSGTSEIDPSSAEEFRRLVRMIHGNPSRSFSFVVTLQGFQKDSVRSNPDLTEVIIDTLTFPVSYRVDSATTAVRDSLVIKTTYHNNRTASQAKALVDYLSREGIPTERMSYSSTTLPEAILENRKTLVKVAIR